MYTGRLLGWTIRGSTPGRGKNILPSPKLPDHIWGPQPPFSCTLKIFPGGGFRRWVKRPESEAGHSSQCGMNAANVLLPLQQAPSWPAPGNLTFTVTRRILCMPSCRTWRKNLGSEICFGVFATAVRFAVTSHAGFTACINEMLYCAPLLQVV